MPDKWYLYNGKIVKARNKEEACRRVGLRAYQTWLMQKIKSERQLRIEEKRNAKLGKNSSAAVPVLSDENAGGCGKEER
jgi:hypothetical protein